jgi:hypothetical protein
VTLVKAKAKFSAVMNGVQRSLHRYLIARTRRPDPTPAGALALVGAWSEVENEAIDEFLDEILRLRADPGRPVEIG